MTRLAVVAVLFGAAACGARDGAPQAGAPATAAGSPVPPPAPPPAAAPSADVGTAGRRPAPPAAAAAPGRYAEMSDEQVSQRIAAARRADNVGDRIQQVTQPFLGTPYVLGNMGEGPDGDGRDRDPRYNVKSADCTTFVEHAMAFAHATDVSTARALLDRIRYADGRVGYGTRRHWPEAQWVAGLVAEGWLEDVTARVAAPDVLVHTASIRLDPEVLKQSAHQELKQNLKDGEIPTGEFGVPYVPLSRVAAVAPRLEAGMIINVVKALKAGLLTRISHQGLIVRHGDAVFVRHASSAGPVAVMDQPLAEFVAKQSTSRNWPAVGFNFLRVKDAVPPPAKAAPPPKAAGPQDAGKASAAAGARRPAN